MTYNGPIVIVEDDEDDVELIQEAIHSTGFTNLTRVFGNGLEALEYLKTTSETPFLILSDINMHIMTGLQLIANIFENKTLRMKAIPFVFLTTSTQTCEIRRAYELSIQGYFEKPATQAALNEVISEILHYWLKCQHPI